MGSNGVHSAVPCETSQMQASLSGPLPWLGSRGTGCPLRFLSLTASLLALTTRARILPSSRILGAMPQGTWELGHSTGGAQGLGQGVRMGPQSQPLSFAAPPLLSFLFCLSGTTFPPPPPSFPPLAPPSLPLLLPTSPSPTGERE